MTQKGHNSFSFHRRKLKLVFLERKLKFANNAPIFGALGVLKILPLPVVFDFFSLNQADFLLTQQFFFLKLLSSTVDWLA